MAPQRCCFHAVLEHRTLGLCLRKRLWACRRKGPSMQPPLIGEQLCCEWRSRVCFPHTLWVFLQWGTFLLWLLKTQIGSKLVMAPGIAVCWLLLQTTDVCWPLLIKRRQYRYSATDRLCLAWNPCYPGDRVKIQVCPGETRPGTVWGQQEVQEQQIYVSSPRDL